MKRIAETFAQNLRKLRKEKRLSQQALAERVDVSVITIQNYEGMRRWPSPEMIHSLAKSLGVAESALFADSEVKLPAERIVWAVSEALGIAPANQLPARKPARRSKKRRRTARPSGS